MLENTEYNYNNNEQNNINRNAEMNILVLCEFHILILYAILQRKKGMSWIGNWKMTCQLEWLCQPDWDISFIIPPL
jgi:hypothetical protein